MVYFVTDSIRLVTVKCSGCGTTFAMDEYVNDQKRKTGKTFHCPNGCKQHYGKTTADYLQAELDKKNKLIADKNRTLDNVRGERDAAERSARGYKGAVTRLKNRVKNGVCPCCNRHFKDLERHMKSKHPKFVDEDHGK